VQSVAPRGRYDNVDVMVSNKDFINRSLDNFSPCNFCITLLRVLGSRGIGCGEGGRWMVKSVEPRGRRDVDANTSDGD
jgi:hypothetical protein